MFTILDTIKTIDEEIAYYEKELKIRFLFKRAVGISYLMDKIEDLNVAKERLVDINKKIHNVTN